MMKVPKSAVCASADAPPRTTTSRKPPATVSRSLDSVPAGSLNRSLACRAPGAAMRPYQCTVWAGSVQPLTPLRSETLGDSGLGSV